MRMRSAFQVVLVLCLFVALAGVLPPAPALASCAAPITPGAWSGSFTRTLTGQSSKGKLVGQITTTTDISVLEIVAGSLALQVACDGTLTGSLSNETLNSTFNADVTSTNINTRRSSSTSIPGGCTGISQAKVTGGSVAVSEVVSQALPVFTLNVTVAWDSFVCAPAYVQSAYNNSGGRPGYAATFTLVASRASATAIGGTAWRSSDPQPNAVRDIYFPKLGITPTIVMSWQLNGPPPPVTATPEPDAPVITSLTPLYQQYFLLGVHTVLNQYTAVVDWKDGTPGQVDFTLGAAAPETLNSEPYSFTWDMGDLPGSAILSVVAINGEGKSSVLKQMSVDIVPMPAWAQRLTVTPVLKNGYVDYVAVQTIPSQPFTKGYVEIDNRIPFFGGPYGFLPFQLNANLTIDSRGQQGQNTVTGLGGAAWGKDKQVDLTIGGETRTTLSATQLNFDSGQAKVTFPPATFEKYYGLFDLIPGARSYESLPFVGRILQALADLVSIGGKVTATIGGQGALGIKNNQVDATSGQFQLRADVVVNVLRLGIKSAYVAAGGGGRGDLSVIFSPEWGLGGCSVSMYLRAVAYAFGYQAEARSQPWGYVCDTSSALSSASVLSAPLDLALRVPARPAAWQPEQVVAQVSVAGDLTTTVLVENASPNAAPALALAPSGQAALAWVTEDPSHSRPQSNEIRLRLSDGHNWGAPIELTHDTRPDFNPQAAFDAQGHVVVAWLQNRLDNLPADSTLDDNFLQNLEIAYAVVDAKTGSLVSTGQLTKDSVLDFDPHLATARDGTVWLAWQASPGLNAIGSAAAPNQLRAAAWDGKQWSAVETVTDKLANTLWWSLAAQDKQNALVAADTAAASSGSRDILIYQRAVGGWAPARQLTHGGADNIGPRAAYTPEGRPVLAWYSDQSIRGLAGDLNSAPSIWFTTTVDSGAALGAGSLLAGAGGQLALVWPGSAPNGPDVWLAHYDPATQVWAGPAPVFGDSSQEADLSAAVREDGTLLLGLARVATTTESVTVPGGAAIDVPASGPTASLVVAEVPGVFETAGSPAQASANGLTWLFLAGLVVVAILVLGGVGLVFVLRRRS